MKRLELMQWVGIFVAPAAWIGQHLIGQAIAQASCSVANVSWGISNDAWQIVLLVVSCVLILLSEGAAVLVYLGTRGAEYTSPPPSGRLQLFSIAAMTANVLFLAIVVLDGIASVVDISCRQS